MQYEAHREAGGADTFTANMRQVGLALRRSVPSSTRIALNPAGAVPYYSGLYAYDMLGLTNEHIAHVHVQEMGTGRAGHEKGDGRYILDQRPENILFGNVAIASRLPDLSEIRWPIQGLSEREMSRDPRLTSEYVPASLPLDDGRFLLFLRRRDVEISSSRSP
jgi:hypothetical protein